MLLKCRAAIEQLQEELGSCRRQNEALKKVGARKTDCQGGISSPWKRLLPTQVQAAHSNPGAAGSCRRASSRRSSCKTQSNTYVWWRANWRARPRSAPTCWARA